MIIFGDFMIKLTALTLEDMTGGCTKIGCRSSDILKNCKKLSLTKFQTILARHMCIFVFITHLLIVHIYA